MCEQEPATRCSEPVVFAGCDYLGLTRDGRLADALADACRAYGIGMTSSRWAVGWTDLHERLECELADFFAEPLACLLGKAFLGGIAYFSAMAADHDVVYFDEFRHDNLLLGARAAGFEVRTFRHLDADDLRRKLRAHRGRPPIVATDTVFSISGELAPLVALRDAAQACGAPLLLDEAHAVFAMGASGRGAAEACGLEPGEATLLGSMGKALGTDGGFLVGSRDLMTRLRHTSGATGSSGPPTPIVAASLEAIRIVRDEPDRRARVEKHGDRMRRVLQRHGVPVACDRTPIVTLLLGDATEAMRLADHFQAHGLRIPYFKYTSEPRDDLLRAVARSCYTDPDLDRFDQAVSDWAGT